MRHHKELIFMFKLPQNNPTQEWRCWRKAPWKSKDGGVWINTHQKDNCILNKNKYSKVQSKPIIRIQTVLMIPYLFLQNWVIPCFLYFIKEKPPWLTTIISLFFFSNVKSLKFWKIIVCGMSDLFFFNPNETKEHKSGGSMLFPRGCGVTTLSPNCLDYENSKSNCGCVRYKERRNT